ncbi:hypothetical protein D7D52_02720 [Nocardia yunnanensis]|uniref:Resolvase/invertase-type recombinase catalytic domain-containing protein n=1 Tax=Nocardia yunnanensis TaxID=2382165 RepID=A0A386Z8Z9_9NOCA|nr:hypothetical protein [Nocardia yunnanensis]AYF72959.1 hypothetical protein D7D52_02720 [Nocardia yunnanensis]
MSNYVIGFLRPDVSGAAWSEDESRIHALATERGWSVILVYYGEPDRPDGALINRLMNLAYGEHADAVIAPSTDHFEPGEIAALVKIADVICADTGTGHTLPATTSTPNRPGRLMINWQ